MANGKYKFGYFDEEAFQQIIGAAPGRPMRKGDRHSGATKEDLRLKALARSFRRMVAKREEREAARRARVKPRQPWRETAGARILAVMQPGAFYAVSDVAAASGVVKNTAYARVYQTLLPAGWIARHANADHDPNRLSGGNPEYLWTLTEAGEAKRAALLEELKAA